MFNYIFTTCSVFQIFLYLNFHQVLFLLSQRTLLFIIVWICQQWYFSFNFFFSKCLYFNLDFRRHFCWRQYSCLTDFFRKSFISVKLLSHYILPSIVSGETLSVFLIVPLISCDDVPNFNSLAIFKDFIFTFMEVTVQI